MVKALAAGAVLVAAALPLAAAGIASAATVPPASYATATGPATAGATGVPTIFGPGYSGTVTVVFNASDALLLNGSGSASLSTTAAGVTFGTGTESVSTATQVVATISTTAAVISGYYPITVTDTAGAVTVLNAYFVNPAPTITSVAPVALAEGLSGVSVTLTGTGFVSGAKAQLALNGVIMDNSSGGTTNTAISTLTYASPTTLTGTVNTNALNSGLYVASVTNGDGSSVSSATVGITVTGPTITAISPNSLAIPLSGSTTTTVTLTGTDFQTGAYVSLTYGGVLVGTTTVVSATSVTVPITVASGTPFGATNFTLTNPDGSSVVSRTSAGQGLGIGEDSGATATITAVSTLPTLNIGANASLSITGTNFGPALASSSSYLPYLNFNDVSGLYDNSVQCTSVTVISDTQLNCIVNVAAGAISGPHSVQVYGYNAPVNSVAFANALTVSGPVITAITPGAVVGSFNGAFTVTGTGFSPSDSYTALANGSVSQSATVVVSAVTATSMTFTTSGSTIAAGQNIVFFLVDSTTSQTADNASVAVVVAPNVLTITYPTGTTGVGEGAFAQPVTLTGTGFLPGATVTFGVTTGITATVTSVTPTVIHATIAASATATLGSNVLTVTNTNGGTGTLPSGLKIDPTPGTLVATPAAVLAGAKSATITITSAGIAAGATVTSSSPLVTITTVVAVAGAVTFKASAPSITGTVPVGLSLKITNLDGGSSSVAFAINPGPTVTGTYYVPTFSTNVEVNVTGTGFETGMTASSSNAAYVVSVAAVSSSTSATLLVSTTSAATTGTNSNIVLTNPDASTVTFVLNGGPAPKVVVAGPHCSSVTGFAITGKTSVIVVHGSGFYGQPRIATNGGPGTRAVVSRDTGTALTIRFTVKGGRRGVHVMSIRLANGKACQIHYVQK